MENVSKWNLVIDVERCTNCHNCFLTIKDEYCENEFPGYSLPQPRHGHRWLNINKRERGSGSLMDVAYLPVTCNQCDNAPCVAKSNGAVLKRKDGIVVIDLALSKGRKDIVDLCPYGHIWWNEELQIPQKWSWDAHLLDKGWKYPRPVSSCGSRAFQAFKLTDGEMDKKSKDEKLEVLRPELNTRPRIWYKNLHRFKSEFIAGSVAFHLPDGREDCLEGAQVKLSREGEVASIQLTNYFGDFKFDHLGAHSGAYTLEISHGGKTLTETIDLDLSVNVGVRFLD
ncbi:MAG: oxidoreductase [Deltaproteobacteria bacterium]|jgi:Fe-S-cluster-containing dehydrogenase component|nr:oxidoreductase [Deltaproteobacteria bacterium]